MAATGFLLMGGVTVCAAECKKLGGPEGRREAGCDPKVHGRGTGARARVCARVVGWKAAGVLLLVCGLTKGKGQGVGPASWDLCVVVWLGEWAIEDHGTRLVPLLIGGITRGRC